MDYNIPKNLKYSPSHEWILIENEEGIIGITDYAQDQLGDIVYVEFPEVGEEFSNGESIAEIESVKAVEEFNIPVSGKIIEINDEINENPELVNESPYEKGWLARIKLANLSELENLLSSENYISQINKELED
ncbi:MAG: glycine cleavage system protein GcvH [Candidatus Lokiarchaeota archaeon]|nr:glycine cleavage system protein GcvH [Candidatus Lokiarchaeota archaeon]MBD3199479.1 glycine cleavage system protein GcvH [Candidatus Lokiarchaeota archaeon]